MKKYILFIVLLFSASIIQATEFMTTSKFDLAQSEIKFSLMNNQIDNQKFLEAGSDEIIFNDGTTSDKKAKSPLKAFVMSLILPGLGQHYTESSKLKSLAFLGAEVATWALYFKLDKDADNLNDEFEQFNRDHWIESRYFDMLDWTYGVIDDDSATGIAEISHHLPDSRTQQYYEMTGKYNQFSWGWDDAVLLSDGTTYEDYSASNPFDFVLGTSVPYSSRRITYEQMRDDANNKYDQARKMVYVSMLNHMISAFEAMIAAKKYNNRSEEGSFLLSLSAEASLKSYYVKRDTPFFTLSMKF